MPWTHYGYNRLGRWCKLRPTIKAKLGTWYLLFEDGREIDTRYASSGRDRVSKRSMEQTLSHRKEA